MRRSSDACARPSRENCMKLVKVNSAKEFLSRALLKLPQHLNGAVFRNIFIMILEYCYFKSYLYLWRTEGINQNEHKL